MRFNRKNVDRDDPKEKKLMEHHSQDVPYPFKHLQDPDIPYTPEADRQEYSCYRVIRTLVVGGGENSDRRGEQRRHPGRIICQMVATAQHEKNQSVRHWHMVVLIRAIMMS